jgi:acetyltransferase-like isoleucine patch superfamily enzyme
MNNPTMPSRIADVPPDFEQVEFRWNVAPAVPTGLALAQRLIGLPGIGGRFIPRVRRYFREDHGTYLFRGFRCLYGNLLVARGVNVSDNFFIDYAPVVLHEDALLSWGNTIITSTHDYEGDITTIIARPIVIERNVWITSQCVILGGVRIGENSVVAAGSVVTKSVPPNVLVGGNPARVIREVRRRWSAHA